MTSPIWPSSGRCKVAVFYFTINNLPYFFQTTRRSILMCLVALRTTVKEIGVKQIMQPILEELETLKQSIDLGLKYKVKGYVCAIIGDNLATNELAGLSTNFRTNSCKYCTIHYNQLETRGGCYSLPNEDLRFGYRDYSNSSTHDYPLKSVNLVEMPFAFDCFHDINEGSIKKFICEIFLPLFCKETSKKRKFIDGMEKINWHDKGIFYNHEKNDLKGKGMQVNQTCKKYKFFLVHFI